MVIFQFKASHDLRDNGATRRFKAPHHQMVALLKRVRRPREIFCVLPNVGTTLELGQNLNLLSQTWVLDVAALPVPAQPTKPDGSIRKSGEHFLDLAPPIVTVRSDPFRVKAMSLSELAGQLGANLSGPPHRRNLHVEDYEQDDRPFGRNSLALGIGPGV